MSRYQNELALSYMAKLAARALAKRANETASATKAVADQLTGSATAGANQIPNEQLISILNQVFNPKFSEYLRTINFGTGTSTGPASTGASAVGKAEVPFFRRNLDSITGGVSDFFYNPINQFTDKAKEKLREFGNLKPSEIFAPFTKQRNILGGLNLAEAGVLGTGAVGSLGALGLLLRRLFRSRAAEQLEHSPGILSRYGKPLALGAAGLAGLGGLGYLLSGNKEAARRVMSMQRASRDVFIRSALANMK